LKILIFYTGMEVKHYWPMLPLLKDLDLNDKIWDVNKEFLFSKK
jgi:hypothetical protein